MKLHFITSNQGKIEEAKARLGPLGFDVVGVTRHLEEIQADRIEDIAAHKARQLIDKVPTPFFIEDAGLHVHALSDFPGPYSNFVFRTIGCDGILRLLREHAPQDRRAHFLAVIAFVDQAHQITLFTGRADGHIAQAMRGDHGFGFDPIFTPNGEKRTFAELTNSQKGAVSHRGHALDQLAQHLRQAASAVSGKKP